MVPRLLPGPMKARERAFMGFSVTSTRRPAACRLHGSLTPAWFSRGRPHCLRRVWACHAQRAADCGWTGVSLSPLLVIAAPGAARRSQRADGRSLPGQVMARPLKWLMLIAMTMGMCLMNGLFGCHGSPARFAPPPGRRMSLYYLPKLEPGLQPSLLQNLQIVHNFGFS